MLGNAAIGQDRLPNCVPSTRSTKRGDGSAVWGGESMSVIPLTIDGPDPTVVQTEEEFHRRGALEDRALLIKDLDVSQLRKPRESNVSYDLRIGRQYRDHRERRIKDIPEDGVITFHPGAALII